MLSGSGQNECLNFFLCIRAFVYFWIFLAVGAGLLILCIMSYSTSFIPSVITEKATLLHPTKKQHDSGVSSGRASDRLEIFLNDVLRYSQLDPRVLDCKDRVVVIGPKNSRNIGQGFKNIGDNHANMAKIIRHFRPTASSSVEVEQKRGAPDGHMLSEEDLKPVELIDDLKRSHPLRRCSSHQPKEHLAQKHNDSRNLKARPGCYHKTVYQCNCQHNRFPTHPGMCPEDEKLLNGIKILQDKIIYGRQAIKKIRKDDLMQRNN
uniref:Uncharacterized protein n=1 Tax=Panagrolaimus sp. JU765 TaxID=591449 RepID=A0AC34Q138_9BILA